MPRRCCSKGRKIKGWGNTKKSPGPQGKHEAAQKQPTYSGRAVMLFMKQKTSKTKNRRLGSRMQSTGRGRPSQGQGCLSCGSLEEQEWGFQTC